MNCASPHQTSTGQGLATACLLITAFLFAFTCGMRGFFPFDQSIVFDAACRVAGGQTPYRDFLWPFGPVSIWIQAALFHLLGVSYLAYVLHSAIANALATAFVMYIVSRLYADSRIAPLLAGLVTATWFYAPFGTPWPEQTAFFFGLAGITLSIRARTEPRPIHNAIAWSASGACVALACLSKQNAGLFLAPLFPCLAMIRGNLHRAPGLPALGWMTLGGLMISGGFSLWLFSASDPNAFWTCFFRIPSELGASRLTSASALFSKLFIYSTPSLILMRTAAALALLAVAVIPVIRLWQNARRNTMATTDPTPVILAAYAIVFQFGFYISSYNEFENSMPYTGLALGLLAGLYAPAFPKNHRHTRRQIAIRFGTILTGVTLALFGAKIGLSRHVHDIFETSAFDKAIDLPTLRGLRWACPTQVETDCGPASNVTASDIEALCAELKRLDQHFFVFPDFTILYGVMGTVSPQPVPWFHKGLTYSAGDRTALDLRIIQCLETNDVRVVVIETMSFFGTQNRLRDFPNLQEWLKTKFTLEQQIGIFSILIKRS